jgi:hypothetical protein
VAAARAFLRSLLPLTGPEDMVGAVAFAGRAAVLAHPAHGPYADVDAVVPAGLDAAPLEPGETDIAAAVARAAPLCPESRQAALVLFSDGNETSGSVAAELALGGGHTPVYAVVPPPRAAPGGGRAARDPSGDRPGAHDRARGGRRRGTRADDGGPRPRDRRRAHVAAADGADAGPERRLDAARFAEAGARAIVARLRLPAVAGAADLPAPPADGVTVTRALQVLLVSERDTPVVGAALDGGGLDVHAIPARRAARAALAARRLPPRDPRRRRERAARAADPRGAPRLGRPRRRPGRHRRAARVRRSRLRRSPLERVLPVTFQSQKPERRKRDPIAIYVIIDRSNSMGYASSTPPIRAGEKMEYAKRAALAVLDQLGPRISSGRSRSTLSPTSSGRCSPSRAAGRRSSPASARSSTGAGPTSRTRSRPRSGSSSRHSAASAT